VKHVADSPDLTNLGRRWLVYLRAYAAGANDPKHNTNKHRPYRKTAARAAGKRAREARRRNRAVR